jgi:sec-independent protein translocase protein TatA
MIPGPSELILILLIVVVVFGAKRIPEIMGGLGQGIRTFKKAMEGEDTSPSPPAQSAPNQQPSLTQSQKTITTVNQKGDHQ